MQASLTGSFLVCNNKDMNMKTMIHELLNANLGVISAHPDDDITQAHALQAHTGKAAELIYTYGKRTTLNYRRDEQPPFDPVKGDRAHEVTSAAPFLNIGDVEILDFPDGELDAYHPELVEVTAEWILRHDLETILTLGGLHDHRDHVASGRIARLAAAQVARRQKRQIHLLELQDHPPAEARILRVEATPAGMEQAMHAAFEYGSQFNMVQGVHKDWPLVPGGYSMNPDTYADLSRYPLFHDASYVHYFTSPIPEPAGIIRP
jgi:LmbE family N-acetylglucosaminyl deacetylase